MVELVALIEIASIANKHNAATMGDFAEKVLSALRETDADVVRMSGSGATCFALYRRHDVMRKAAENLASAHPGWWSMQGELR